MPPRGHRRTTPAARHPLPVPRTELRPHAATRPAPAEERPSPPPIPPSGAGRWRSAAMLGRSRHVGEGPPAGPRSPCPYGQRCAAGGAPCLSLVSRSKACVLRPSCAAVGDEQRVRKPRASRGVTGVLISAPCVLYLGAYNALLRPSKAELHKALKAEISRRFAAVWTRARAVGDASKTQPFLSMHSLLPFLPKHHRKSTELCVASKSNHSFLPKASRRSTQAVR